jgi:hypothetical protein
MKHTINLALRALCLLVYAAALAHLSGHAELLPAGSFSRAPLVAAVLLTLHTLELVFMFKHVRLYPGRLSTSVILTLLFGLLHWKPLLDRRKRADRAALAGKAA